MLRKPLKLGENSISVIHVGALVASAVNFNYAVQLKNSAPFNGFFVRDTLRQITTLMQSGCHKDLDKTFISVNVRFNFFVNFVCCTEAFKKEVKDWSLERVVATQCEQTLLFLKASTLEFENL